MTKLTDFHWNVSNFVNKCNKNMLNEQELKQESKELRERLDEEELKQETLFIEELDNARPNLLKNTRIYIDKLNKVHQRDKEDLLNELIQIYTERLKQEQFRFMDYINKHLED